MSIIGDAMKEKEIKDKAKSGVKPTNLILRVPVIHKFKTAEQETINKAVVEVRKYIAEIPDHMTDLIKRIRGIQTASLEEKAIRSKELKDLEDEVLAHLSSEEELLANAARQAYAMAMVETLPPDKRLVAETIKGSKNFRLPGLMELKILEPVDDIRKNVVVATVKVYGDVYKVIGRREFATKLIEALSDGAARAAKAAHERYHNEVEVLKAQATISIDDLIAKKPGRFFKDISDAKDGERFLPGGALLAESDGRNVKVLKVCGHFQRVMEEIRDTNTFVIVASLSEEKPPYIPDKEVFRRVRIFHAILRRGIAEACKEELPHVKPSLELVSIKA